MARMGGGNKLAVIAARSKHRTLKLVSSFFPTQIDWLQWPVGNFAPDYRLSPY